MNKYDWNARDYAEHSTAQQEWARELIAKLHLQGSESIIDIGFVTMALFWMEFIKAFTLLGEFYCRWAAGAMLPR